MKSAILIVMASVMVLAGCTSWGFIPEEGTGAKFNLATVDYIKAQNDSLTAQVTANVQAALDTLFAEDLEKITEFASLLDSLDTSLADLYARMDTLEMSTNQSVASMSKELSAVKTNASSTRMVIRRINDNIETLPVKALETFNEAINQYLSSQQEEEGGQ